ncbi:hypothetical protein F4780DRAFT_305282 [Xylariomycetidae sp. FL0641]|nr:hypothetical protein F4780DRAFT_305282 [Xylariomycetidae sp. FL0641]
MVPPLPNEIIHCIFTQLQPRIWQTGNAPPDIYSEKVRHRTLSAASRASKLFRHLALPKLYHTIPTTSPQLLRTLSEHDELVNLVKEIDLTDYLYDYPGELEIEILERINSRLRLPEHFHQRMREFIADEQDSERRKLATNLIYLLLLPKLETIETCGYGSLTRDIGFTEFSSQAGEVIVPQLRHLRLRHWDTEFWVHISEVDDLLLPSIETLFAYAASWELGEAPDGLSKTPSRLGLRHIEWIESAINSDGLEDLLRRCPKLRTLRIEWPDASRTPEWYLDFRGMGDSLRRHAVELEELYLDPSEHLGYQEGFNTGDNRIGSLRELSKLKKLDITHDVLAGVDPDTDDEEDSTEARPFTLEQLLPDNLEALTFLNCQTDEERLDEQIGDMLRGGRLSKLRRIRMLTREEGFHGDLEGLGWKEWHRFDKVVLKKL